VGPIGVVLDPPVLDELLSLLEAHEVVLVQAFLPELPIEGFNITVLNGLAGPDEVELHIVAVSPFIQCLADELSNSWEEKNSLYFNKLHFGLF